MLGIVGYTFNLFTTISMTKTHNAAKHAAKKAMHSPIKGLAAKNVFWVISS
jgi:hypothetical protein